MSVRTYQKLAAFTEIAKTLAAFVFLAAVVCAQEEPSDSPVGEESLKPGVNLLYKNPETGVVSRMPFTPEMLNDVLRRAQLQVPSDLFDYVELKITGETKADVVYLNVSLRVDVLVDNERILVPAGFDEFRIRELHHEADSTTAWGKLDSSELPLKNWILFGKGEHRLEFALIGKTLATTNGQQRLRVNVPVVATSHLELTIDETVESAILTNGIAPLIKPGSQQDTSVLNSYGLAAQTELTWTPKQTATNETVLLRASPATMELDLTTDPGSLRIKQPLVISGGVVDELKIKLPEKFTQVSITGMDAEGESIVSAFLQSGDKWIVPFIRPISGPITLEYDLGLERKEYSGSISVTIPEIQGATSVTGNLEVSVPYGIDVQFTGKNTRRIRVVSPVDSRTRVTAYRLLSTKSQLNLAISETEAFFSVTPHISFETVRQENTLALTARFKVNVLRGSLPELTLAWPDFLSDGWRISGDLRLTTDENSRSIPGYSPDSDPSQFPIDLGEHQSGQFEVELQAFRDLASVQDANGILFLPDVVASTPHSTIVSLIESDADSITLSRPDNQRSYSILPPSQWPVELRDREAPLTAWLVDSPEKEVQIRLQKQTPEVRISADVSLALDGDRIRIQEVIHYEVRHEDLSEIRLAIADRTPRVRLRETAEQLDSVESSTGSAVFRLPAPRRGKFDILVDYFWRPSESVVDANDVLLPLVRPAQEVQVFESLTVATNVPESILLSASEAWRRVYSDELQAAWHTSQITAQVPVRLLHGLDALIATPPAFVVADSAAWGSFLLTSVTFLYDGPTDRILFSLDSRAELWGDATVDGFRAIPVRVSGGADGRSIYQVTVSESAPSGRLTKLRLVVKQPFGQRHELFSVVHPALPEPIGSENSPTTLWVMSQTSQQTLFDPGGKGMTSVGGGVMSRLLGKNQQAAKFAIDGMLLPYNPELRASVKDCLAEIETSGLKYEMIAGNVYSSEQTVVVVTRRLVFLISAIFAVITYLICLRTKASCVILLCGMTLTAVAFVFTMVPDAVHVLFAQAVPGICVAVVAAVAQRYFMRERESPFRGLGDSDGNTVFEIDQSASALDLATPSASVN